MDTNAATNLLASLSQRRFLSMTRRECDWVIALEHDTQIMVECLWRVIEAGRVQRTSLDHGQQFGLAAPIDAAVEINRRLAGQLVRHAELCAGTLDFELHLDPGVILQVIPDSAGYESWRVSTSMGQFIAVGGGELTTLHRPVPGQ